MTSSCQIPSAKAPYSGDLLPQEAFAFLQANEAVLVDVRTPEEWANGIPDISSTNNKCFTIAWKLNPGYVHNPQFESELEAALGGRKDLPIVFMCKGGGRSQDAAMTLTAAGYTTCYNMAGGFEGRPDLAGWRAQGLPCKQGSAA